VTIWQFLTIFLNSVEHCIVSLIQASYVFNDDDSYMNQSTQEYMCMWTMHIVMCMFVLYHTVLYWFWCTVTLMYLPCAGLDYVGHEDVLPYKTTQKQPIFNHLFDKFLVASDTTAGTVATHYFR